MTDRQHQILNAIYDIEKPYPADDMIVTYRNFCKHRHSLFHFRYNPILFDSLVKLTYDLWETTARINRFEMLKSIASYGKRNDNKLTVPEQTSEKIFYLFKEVVIYGRLNYSHQILERAKSSINIALKDLEISDENIVFLLAKADRSPYVLNRILRYPLKNRLISIWVKKNFIRDIYRERRAEMVGWMIDENPSFCVDMQEIIGDFEYVFKKDKKALRNYEDEVVIHEVLKERGKKEMKEMYDLLPEDAPSVYSYLGWDLSGPELDIPRRIYGRPYDINKKLPVWVPDLDVMRKNFYDNTDFFYRLTMLWGTAYSHTRAENKYLLYMKYYRDELFPAALKIGVKTQDTVLLKWLSRREEHKKRKPINKR